MQSIACMEYIDPLLHTAHHHPPRDQDRGFGPRGGGGRFGVQFLSIS